MTVPPVPPGASRLGSDIAYRYESGHSEDEPTLSAILAPVWARKGLVLLFFVVGGAAGYTASRLITPTFTARTTLLPPQQQQSLAASALASLGPLAGLAGVSGSSLRSPADQYVALLQSVLVSDRIVERFGLMKEYSAQFKVDARSELGKNVRVLVGKKDGLISIEVDDAVPERAARIANHYVSELRSLTSTLAISEAQQRRAFFEKQMEAAKARLIVAQVALEGSGFTQGALRAEPKAAAESYARLKAEITSAEVRLQTLRGTLTDNTTEVRKQQASLAALRGQLGRIEQSAPADDSPGYVGKYREFKYQETLFELFARQYEAARLDESREGALIQVLDEAQPAERPSSPRRGLFAGVGCLLGATAAAVWAMARAHGRRTARSPSQPN